MSLPVGFRVRLADGVRVADDGRALVGGSPLRVLRLSDRARAMLGPGGLRVDDDATAEVAERLLAANMALPVLRPEDRPAYGDLAVIVPVRDRAGQLDRALARLDGLTVVVVDDASHDPDAVAEVARSHGATVVRHRHNTGPAAARNTGLRHVDTAYVAFVDCDVEVDADTLLGLAAHLTDPAVALVGPHLRGLTVNDPPRWFERYELLSPALGLGDRGGLVRPGAAVAWLPSACLVGRTDRLRFTDSLRVGEDVDLVWRLADAGQRVRYDPSFVARHEVRPTLRTWLGRKFVYGTGGAVLAERHRDHVVTAVLSPTMGLAALTLLLRSRLALPLAVVAVVRGAGTIRAQLPEFDGRTSLAARLSVRGLGWALRQESALALRHWWPVVVPLALVSRRARRLVVSALVVDVVAARLERPEQPALIGLAGRRLDDLAYGGGLWWGALRHRSARCLRIRLVRRSAPAG